MLSENHKKVLKQVALKLKENNIQFQISGGLAAITYGAKRPLYDIDIDVHKGDIQKVRELFKDYDKAIMEPAIERVAGNHLKNIKDDKVFDAQLEELQRKYQNWYYTTAYKYKLPTSRIIPFILRLIN